MVRPGSLQTPQVAFGTLRPGVQIPPSRQRLLVRKHRKGSRPRQRAVLRSGRRAKLLGRVVPVRNQRQMSGVGLDGRPPALWTVCVQKASQIVQSARGSSVTSDATAVRPVQWLDLRDDLDETLHTELGMLPAVLGVHKAGLDVVTGWGVEDLLLHRSR